MIYHFLFGLLYIIFANKHYMNTLVPEIKFKRKLFDFAAVKEL